MCEYNEEYRPQIHFSQPRMWMNDPNGLVYHNGFYHLFYQHNPFATVWGPMHWGHAVSKDLIHWTHLPIALYPNKLGTIFSGCALVDYRNVTGFQRNKKTKVLIAVFTQHIFHREEEPQEYIQYQSLAYSIDNGYRWKMYKNNPIIRAENNETSKKVDFRDPNIIEYNDYFVLVLAAFNKVIFYRSDDLKQWSKLSEFGAEPKSGHHGGIWECPDLIYFKSIDIWVLLVSINPGGPNNGSATQYFIGKFDGERFINLNSPETKLWVDYGPDSYAGITWFGRSLKQKVFISWMNNWHYGKSVPTKSWRGQMTIPRYLHVSRLNNNYYLRSTPINLNKIQSKKLKKLFNINLTANKHTRELQRNICVMVMKVTLLFNIAQLSDQDSFQLCLRNENESVCVGFNNVKNEYFINRSNVGNTTFHPLYTVNAYSPRLSHSNYMHWQLIIDKTSVELFADHGFTVMTALFFPNKPLTRIELQLFTSNYSSKLTLVESYFRRLKSIWNHKAGR
ncbi:hypothetical protein B4U80_13557 [Leptotrombidium deliense]|uniref:Uncharacterized protein n=1 Tax=Leptotrombidium deliense TaxID=299467 RepID=A0A443S4G9_9ACAR|nr:hypothetical protein B4U80_13557 [Leptotrombidium deliense]